MGQEQKKCFFVPLGASTLLAQWRWVPEPGDFRKAFLPPYVKPWRTFQHCQDCAGERGGLGRLIMFYALITTELPVQRHPLAQCSLLCHSPPCKTKGQCLPLTAPICFVRNGARCLLYRSGVALSSPSLDTQLLDIFADVFQQFVLIWKTLE